METECNGMLPFLGIQLLNPWPQIETKVYVKPTNSGLLLHYQSHVDNRYKKGLLRTMRDRTHRLSSSWTHFSDECDRLKAVFSRLKYPKHLLGRFKVLKKCKNKFDCLVYEMLFIRALKPNLNVQADSIRAKGFL